MPGQQHPLGERVDLEVDRRAVGQQDALLGQVDRQLGVGIVLDEVPQPSVDLRRDDDRQHAVLEALLRKMSAKLVDRIARTPQRGQRPRRVLARGAGAEVVADEQDLAPGHARARSRMNGGSLSEPSSSNRQSRNSASARPALSVTLR